MMEQNLQSFWTHFYDKNKSVLQTHYPGLNLHRFLREVKDILRVLTNSQILEVTETALVEVSNDSLIFLEKSFLEGVPFAYLLKEVDFYFNKFYIDQRVLIPRPETELLVEMIDKEFQKRRRPFTRVLDVGTGSGAILLSLLKQSIAEKGVGVDISENALKVAQINTVKLSLENQVSLILSDRLEKIHGDFDLIVSNPPYIKLKNHHHLVHSQVLRFEPHMALFLDDDIYEDWFTTLFQQVQSHLKGMFFLEGHENEMLHLSHLLKKLNFQNVEVLHDLSGRQRFLRATHLMS